MSVLKAVITLIVIGCLGVRAKRGKDLIDGVYCCSVINFQVAWLIYGNTFHYSSDSIYCQNTFGEFHKLWVLMMVSIAFGYILFIVYLILCCVGSCVICAICCMRREADLRNNPVVARVPYINAVQSLNKKKFENVNENNRAMEQCAICLQDYQDNDEIAELKCDQRHYFHSKCLEEWLHRKLECPLCKKPINVPPS